MKASIYQTFALIETSLTNVKKGDRCTLPEKVDPSSIVVNHGNKLVAFDYYPVTSLDTHRVAVTVEKDKQEYKGELLHYSSGTAYLDSNKTTLIVLNCDKIVVNGNNKPYIQFRDNYDKLSIEYLTTGVRYSLVTHLEFKLETCLVKSLAQVVNDDQDYVIANTIIIDDYHLITDVGYQVVKKGANNFFILSSKTVKAKISKTLDPRYSLDVITTAVVDTTLSDAIVHIYRMVNSSKDYLGYVDYKAKYGAKIASITLNTVSDIKVKTELSKDNKTILRVTNNNIRDHVITLWTLQNKAQEIEIKKGQDLSIIYD